MAAVAGLRGSGDFGADERPKDFREMIMWRNPNGSAPLTALLSRARKAKANDPEFAWWDEPVDIVRLLVNGAVGNTTADMTIVVDSADPSSSAPANNWGLAKHLVPGDILQVEKASETTQTAYTPELLLVKQVVSDTQIVVQRAFAGSTIANIADNAYLLKIGSAFAEGTAEPKSTSRNPIKYSNYMQIFKTAYELTNTTKAIANLRTGNAQANDKKRRMWDHARDLELALMFGLKSEGTGDNGKPLRTTGGLRSFIPATNFTWFGATVTPSLFLDAVYKVFDFDSPAGDERICFCGNTALNFLNKNVINATGSRMELGSTVKVYGMNLRELILPQGRLLLRTHPLMNRNSLYSNAMFVLDFSALEWNYLPGRDTSFMDNIQAKGEDSTRGQWLTEGGLAVYYGGLTCAYLANFQ